MRPAQCAQALCHGVALVQGLPGNALLLGEMGIGNTSAAALLLARLAGLDIAHCTGAGTGLDADALAHKTRVLRSVLERHADARAPLDALAALVAQWASRPVQLRFRDARNLAQVLRAATPAGNRSIGAAAWKLRMDVLRILGQQDDFELVALEYCVTFELSPPAWQDVRCSYLREDPVNPGAEARPKTATPPEDPDTKTEARDSQGNTLPMGYDSAPAVVELSGEILGEATQALARLEAARQGAERLVVSCASLIRVDFSAAGSILNWVARRQSEGCHVQFRDVHRLVGAFFHVIGIHEHARVVLRSN